MIHWGLGIQIRIPWRLSIQTRMGVSVYKLVRIKFVWIVNHYRGGLGIWIWISAIKIRIPRRLGIWTGMGVSVYKLVWIKFVWIVNHYKGGLGIWIWISAIKVWIPRRLSIEARMEVSVYKLVMIKFVQIVNNCRGGLGIWIWISAIKVRTQTSISKQGWGSRYPNYSDTDTPLYLTSILVFLGILMLILIFWKYFTIKMSFCHVWQTIHVAG